MAKVPRMRWRTLIAALLATLCGCSTVKAPPGWPPGEARPINVPSSPKASR